MSQQAIRLRIIAQPADEDDFRAQVALIKVSGAQYDRRTKTWSHRLTPDLLTPEVLNPLFQAAMDYHTSIEALPEADQD